MSTDTVLTIPLAWRLPSTMEKSFIPFQWSGKHSLFMALSALQLPDRGKRSQWETAGEASCATVNNCLCERGRLCWAVANRPAQWNFSPFSTRLSLAPFWQADRPPLPSMQESSVLTSTHILFQKPQRQTPLLQTDQLPSSPGGENPFMSYIMGAAPHWLMQAPKSTQLPFCGFHIHNVLPLTNPKAGRAVCPALGLEGAGGWQES